MHINFACQSQTIALFITLFFVQVSFAQQNLLVDKIVATVGDEIILSSDIEIQYQQALAQGYPTENLRCQIVDQLLLEKMMITQAQIDSIQVADEEVDGELNRRIAYFEQMLGSTEEMEKYYGKTVLQIKDEFRSDIRSQLLAQRMQQKVLSGVSVTPSEVRSYFNKIPKDSIPYLNSEMEVSQLVIKPKVTKAQKQEAKDLLLNIKRKVEEEAGDFAKLAASFSIDPGSAAQGGDLGWAGRGTFVPAFEGAAYRLKPGEISEPVETQFGFHLIQLLERRGDKIHARHILVKPKVSFTELQAAEQTLDSIRNVIIQDTVSFKQAVLKYTEDEETKNTGGAIINPQTGTTLFEADQLDPAVYFISSELEVDEISKPIEFEMKDGSTAYRLLYLVSRTTPHVANLKDDYNKLQQVVEQIKQQEAMMRWLNKHIPRTYIAIDESYAPCETTDKWLKE